MESLKNLEESKEFKFADKASDAVNGSFDFDLFNKSMSCQHRTLQQTFTSMCLHWIKYVGSDEYKTDLRNQYSHEQCKLMYEFMEKNGIALKFPFI